MRLSNIMVVRSRLWCYLCNTWNCRNGKVLDVRCQIVGYRKRVLSFFVVICRSVRGKWQLEQIQKVF